MCKTVKENFGMCLCVLHALCWQLIELLGDIKGVNYAEKGKSFVSSLKKNFCKKK
jgi:hypothetical protein